MTERQHAPDYESAIEGLIILGRTRAEAEAEIDAAQNRQWQKMQDEMWDLDPARLTR